MKLWKLLKYFYSLFSVPERRSYDLNVLNTIISLLGLVGTVIAALGFYVNYRQGQEKLISDLFSQAVEQIGNQSNQSVRIGGIYSLERIAEESPSTALTIMQVLISYVHSHSPVVGEQNSKDYKQMKKIAIDVQAVLTMFGQGKIALQTSHSLDLSNINLKKVNLAKANFENTNFQGVNLEYANLQNINLKNADLLGADLVGANLIGADLVGANLQKANLTGANLQDANLKNVNLIGANLDGAYLVKIKNFVPEQIKEAINWQNAYYEPKIQKELGLIQEIPDL
jgi:hypothetical protein